VRRFRLLVLVLGAVVLSACRLDVTVDLTVNPDGTGQIVLVATVDADVVNQVPGLAGSLRLDDAAAAGWIVERPTSTEAGGMTVTMRHPFASVAEATVLLAALDPPFANVTVGQEATENAITTTLSGTMTLPATWDGYGDAALLQAIGGTPFGAQLTASGATPADAVTVRFDFTAPGGDDVTTWSANGDGNAVDLTTSAALQAGGGGSSWAGPVATLALVLLAVWLLIGGYLAYRVWSAQHRRRNRRPATRYR